VKVIFDTKLYLSHNWGHHGGNHMVVDDLPLNFVTNHKSFEFDSVPWWGVLHIVSEIWLCCGSDCIW